MSESVTLYCKNKCENLETFRKRLTLISPSEVDSGSDPGWNKVKCVTASGTVQFSRLFFIENADRFSKMVWTTIVRIRSVAAKDAERAQEVEAFIRKTEAVIGIVADPGFDQIDKLPELIGFLAMEFDALIFNGSDFMDFRGNTIFSV